MCALAPSQHLRFHQVHLNTQHKELLQDGCAEVFGQHRVCSGPYTTAVIQPRHHTWQVVTLWGGLAVKEVDRVVQPPLGLALKDSRGGDPGWYDLVVELEPVGLGEGEGQRLAVPRLNLKQASAMMCEFSPCNPGAVSGRLWRVQ